MKVLTIIRISSQDQKHGYGPEDQWEEDVLANASKLGLEVSESLKRTIEESATHWEREKFSHVIAEAIQLYRKGEIGGVVFPRVDRETRFVFSSMPFLSDMLRIGMQVFFARELLYLDPKDPEAVERYLDKVGQAQAYVETMRLNTMRGRKRRAKKDGLLPTGGVGLYGYFYDSNTGKRIRNEYEISIIRKMVNWVLKERIFLNEVCRRLMAEEISAPKGGKKWSRSTVGRILRNRVYTGETYAYMMEAVEPKNRRGGTGKNTRTILPKEQWIRLPDDTTPQIITPEEFDAIQHQLARNQELSPRNQKFEYLLRGYVYCQECGRKFYGHPQHGKRYYRCKGRSSLVAPDGICRNRSMNADRLEADVWRLVVDTVMEPERFFQAYKQTLQDQSHTRELEERLEKFRGQLDSLDNAETKLIRIYAFTPMTDTKFKEEMTRIQSNESRVRYEITQIKETLVKRKETVLTKVQIKAASEFLRTSLKEGPIVLPLKRQLFENLRMKVWISSNYYAIELGITPLPISDAVSTPL
ncbi:recombinase family protein [Chloroflexota bacterium]